MERSAALFYESTFGMRAFMLCTHHSQSETYTPKAYAGENPQPVTYDASVHGTRLAKLFKMFPLILLTRAFLAAQCKSAIRITIGLSQVNTLLMLELMLTDHLLDNWFRAMAHLNIPLNPDPDAGLAAGGYFLASDIDPNNQTRCDARVAYYDPVQSRPNLQIMPNTHVTRVLFKAGSSPLVATGVEVRTS
jgi:hypothetical protein